MHMKTSKSQKKKKNTQIKYFTTIYLSYQLYYFTPISSSSPKFIIKFGKRVSASQEQGTFHSSLTTKLFLFYSDKQWSEINQFCYQWRMESTLSLRSTLPPDFIIYLEFKSADEERYINPFSPLPFYNNYAQMEAS